jgi:hypothetical protein
MTCRKVSLSVWITATAFPHVGQVCPTMPLARGGNKPASRPKEAADFGGVSAFPIRRNKPLRAALVQLQRTNTDREGGGSVHAGRHPKPAGLRHTDAAKARAINAACCRLNVSARAVSVRIRSSSGSRTPLSSRRGGELQLYVSATLLRAR